MSMSKEERIAYRHYQYEKEKAKKEKAEAAGICNICLERPARKGYKSCFQCALKRTENAKAWYYRHKAKMQSNKEGDNT